MARDAGLEELVASDLSGLEGLVERTMFGGWCVMWRGNLLAGARDDGILVRLGKGNDGWAVATPGVSPMMMGARRMQGWVRLSPEAAGDDALRRRLLAAARDFVVTLPEK
jgi:hypothetical protein